MSPGRAVASVPLLLGLAFGVATAADTAKRDDAKDKRTRETRAWLTNTFVPWLTNTFPDAPSKQWPDWFVNPPSRTRLPTWLTNTFPKIDTEEFPHWLQEPDPEMLARGIPDFWKDVFKGPPAVPSVKPLPAITRGPYLQLATTNSIVIRWRTDVPTASTVRFGSAPGKLRKEGRASGTLTEHVVLLTNLQPDTKYFYEIGVPDTPLLVALTNREAVVSATNATLYVRSSQTNTQLAAATNGALRFFPRLGRLSLASLDETFVRHTTNTHLIVSTPNNVADVLLSNGAVTVTTTNYIRPLDGGRVGSRSNPTRWFAVSTTTNVTHTGNDEATSFHTHPPIGTRRPYRVWVLGDPGTRKPEQKRVRDAYYRFNGNTRTDLWLMLGDNAYSSGKDEEYQGGLFRMYDAMLRSSVLWPSLGNHDAGSANSPTQSGVYYDIFTLPTQAQAGGVMSGTEAYYSFDYGNIHFVCLDSSDSDWSEDGLMVRWLKADLAANKQDWLVAYCHHPPFTKGSHDSDKDKDSGARMRRMREVVLPLLEAHGLDLLLTGHSHAYERSYLLDGYYGRATNLIERVHFRSHQDGRPEGSGIYTKPSIGPAPREGAIYVVAGSSGQVSGGPLQHPAMCLSLNVLGSLILDFDHHRLDATFIDDQAHVRDYFTIQKGEGR